MSNAPTQLIDRLFCAPTAPYGPYTRNDNGTELLKDTLYRYDMTRDGQHVALQIFQDLEHVSGDLWEQEVRVLLRVSALDHPALPRITDGGYDEGARLAFVATETVDDSLDDVGFQPLRELPLHGFRQFGLLSDALALMHGRGLIHRNLWPGSIQIGREVLDSSQRQVKLGHFEMSSLLSSLLRQMAMGHRAQQEENTRQLLTQLPPRALAYIAPERLALLFPEKGREAFESDRADVFSLGVLAAEWFVGRVSSTVLQEAFEGGRDNPAGRSALRNEIRRNVSQASIARPMRDLILSMLEEHVRSRFTSAEVVTELTRQYDAIVAQWEGPEEPSRLIMYMPAEFDGTANAWGWTTHSAKTVEGRAELEVFLERELAHAHLVHSPSGFQGYGSGPPEELRSAQWVLLGNRGAWFCSHYWRSEGGQKKYFPECLVIRWVRPKEKVPKLVKTPLQRQLSRLTMLDTESGRAAFERARSGKAAWQPMLDSVQSSHTVSSWEADFGSALTWLMDYQAVEVAAREYPYVLDAEAQAGGVLKLRYDVTRDDHRIARHPTPLFALFCASKTRRLPFGSYFDSREALAGKPRLHCRADKEGRPEWRTEVGVTFERKLDDTTILADGPIRQVPARGWVRLVSDIGSDVVLSRQQEALPEFLGSRMLISQLHEPLGLMGYRNRWKHVGQDLEGNAGEVVRDMLANQTLYALQGPPGTGKTTVAKYAVEAYLKDDWSGRILVSAQSNFALDNLALGLTERLKKSSPEVIAIRAALPEADAVDDRVKPYLLEPTTDRLVDDVKAHCAHRLADRSDPPDILEIVGKWGAVVENSRPELMERIQRGANIVFATCAGATPQAVGDTGPFSEFDWVIVEEAAKAWPTELAIPLIRGHRWTLIGDHHQPGPFRKKEVVDLLRECAINENPELRMHGQAESQYVQAFDLFGSLFTRPPRAVTKGRLHSPLKRLRTQFRMPHSVAEVVSRTFYRDPNLSLGTDGLPRGFVESSPHAGIPAPIEYPATFRNRSLVWIDTQGLQDSEEIRCWSNPGEARFIARLLRNMTPAPWTIRSSPHEDALAILTPYWAQVQVLQNELSQATIPGARQLVHTVNSYQGHEANVVIVSLVRNRARSTDPLANIGGLLIEETVTNVLFSRARGLLVIVGSFTHFHESNVEFWRVACELIRRQGRVVQVRELLPGVAQ